ncbi:AAA family ATPase [Rhodococcus pyridinivorans]|uniref:AAA family ATPase n=1 Tax=Rhodococcus pyridinivorans TaxID=103816 RepID=UPI001E6514B7|nr:AAA family ATPase [Rhodococcus pyridinivorans]MCD5422686.1 AAA family ATPase [Rhodococcus pyridinivorans]
MTSGTNHVCFPVFSMHTASDCEELNADVDHHDRIARRRETTYARAWVAADLHARCRVSRDDLRAMLFNAHGRLTPAQEDAVTAAEQARVANLLDLGRDVIVDATHLTDRSRTVWAELAAAMGHDFMVHAVDTPVDECIRRDKARGARGGRRVGAEIITRLHARRSA